MRIADPEVLGLVVLNDFDFDHNNLTTFLDYRLSLFQEPSHNLEVLDRIRQ